MPTAIATLALAGAATVPSPLGLRQALAIAQARAFDVRIADAAAAAAAGDERASRAVANPTFTFGQLRARHYGILHPAADPPENPVATSRGWMWGVSDTALFDALSGKRWLRQDVAAAARQTAASSRDAAQRAAAFAVKQAYAQAQLADASMRLQQETALSYGTSAGLARSRFQAGAISEVDLAKIETAQLEAEQALEVTREQLGQAKAQLAFMLGYGADEQSAASDFQLADSLESGPRVTLPPSTELLKIALAQRPDLQAAQAAQRKAEASLRLARRQRFPDITLAYTYTELGQYQNAITPPTMQLSVSAALPVLYQQQGEIERAERDREAAVITTEKTLASLANDVAQAQLAFAASRHLLERMEGGLLARAQTARDLTAATYQKGAATLLDFLDAQRTYSATRLEYLTDQELNRLALAQLEQAVGIDLTAPEGQP